MKTLALFPLLLLAFLVFPSTSLGQSNVIEGPDFIIEPEPNTENYFLVYEDEGSRTYRFTLKIRLTKETIRSINVAEDQSLRNGLTEEAIEIMLTPFLEKMDAAMDAAEKKCIAYRCKQVIFEPRFLENFDSNQTITNALFGKPAVRTTTVVLSLPKIAIKTPGLISRGIFYLTTSK